MKTKHLFSAAMLTALFAACSNEELVNQTTPNVANDGRPMVEIVKLQKVKLIHVSISIPRRVSMLG